jgi:MFS superfamily sulfate permease-like transporter
MIVALAGLVQIAHGASRLGRAARSRVGDVVV